MEENMNQEQQEIKVLFALTKKSDGSKILTDSLKNYSKGYDIDGICVGGIIVSLSEYQLPFGGTSVDLEEGDPLYDIASPSMDNMDGEWRTAFLIDFFKYGEGTALVEAAKEGWLPSGGEMSLIGANKEAINEKIAQAKGTALGDAAYWTSQKFSNERMWSYVMGENKFTLNNGCVDALAVRVVKSAEGYEEIVNE